VSVFITSTSKTLLTAAIPVYIKLLVFFVFVSYLL